ncbi:MAG TPA: hypothetical protein VJQ45_11320 [Ktedonobacterales bacterium]|nr:hypothetical protein [Ktedonobacterales bacterium]
MATHIEEAAARQHSRRARLTLDIDRALHTRIRLAAFREGISMREYIERILDEVVPSAQASEWTERQPISPDVIERLREALLQQPMQPDSTDLIRRMREERSEHLASL